MKTTSLPLSSGASRIPHEYKKNNPVNDASSCIQNKFKPADSPAPNRNAERNHQIIIILAELERALFCRLSVVAVNGKSFHLNTVVHA